MKTWQVGAALVAFAGLGGAVGGLLAMWLHADEHAIERNSDAEAEVEGEKKGADADEAEQDPELGALRGRVAALERRISLLTAALARDQDSPNEGDPEADAQDPRHADVADPVFEAAVLDIVDRERERADGERDAQRVERRAQRSARVSEALAESLGLDETQKAKLGELITTHFETLRALRSDDNPERPATPREWREKAAAIEQELQASLSTLLTPKQMAAYQALDPDDQIGGGFGRRPRAEPRAEGGPAGR